MTQQPPPGDLLARIAAQSLDDDYATVAARGDGPAPGPGKRGATLLAFGAAVAALCILLTVSVLQTRDTASQADRDREALIDRIEAEQTEVGDLRDEVQGLSEDVDDLRVESLRVGDEAAAVEDDLQDLQVDAGVLPVTGPGVRVTVNDAPNGSIGGQVRDTDLQRLANGLWEAGAEAVAVNGQRLTTRSAIRTAGEAITVNYVSLAPPYVVTAIGDPQTMAADFLETSGGQLLADLRASFGMVFEVESPSSMTLPGLTLDVTHASMLSTAGATS